MTAAPSAAVATAVSAVAMMALCAASDPAPESRAHSRPMPAAASTTSTGRKGAPNHTAASATGAITSAEAIRSFKTPDLGAMVRG